MDQAIEKFEQLLNSTGDLRTAFLLGQLYEEQGNIKKAKSRYEYIIKENFDFLPPNNNLAYLIAENEADQDKLHKALDLAKKAARDSDPHALDTLGWIYHKMGKKDMALKYLKQAKEEDPNNKIALKDIDQVLAGNS